MTSPVNEEQLAAVIAELDCEVLVKTDPSGRPYWKLFWPHWAESDTSEPPATTVKSGPEGEVLVFHRELLSRTEDAVEHLDNYGPLVDHGGRVFVDRQGYLVILVALRAEGLDAEHLEEAAEAILAGAEQSHLYW